MTEVALEQRPLTLDQMYFPAVCLSPHRPFLTKLVDSRGEAVNPRCPICGAPARIIPGSYYEPAHRAHFERVVAVLQHREIGPNEAQRAITYLNALVHESDEQVRAALVAVPHLPSLEDLLPLDREELRRLVSLLAGLLSFYYVEPSALERSARRIPAAVDVDAP